MNKETQSCRIFCMKHAVRRLLKYGFRLLVFFPSNAFMLPCVYYLTCWTIAQVHLESEKVMLMLMHVFILDWNYRAGNVVNLSA